MHDWVFDYFEQAFLTVVSLSVVGGLVDGSFFYTQWWETTHLNSVKVERSWSIPSYPDLWLPVDDCPLTPGTIEYQSRR